MNQIHPYADMHQSHMSATTAHAPSSGPPSGLGHYSQYQPPLLQPGPQPYSAPASYSSQYAYNNALTSAQSASHSASSSMSNALVPQPLSLPAMSSGAPGSTSLTGSQNYQTHTFDTTGQVAPAGMKPRVTATLWEDEGSLCFQVEAKGVCVARREDNHMINGTKLLNVAGMTRGRRDGILKSEKTRHVVKIGPMHLKGVWIPFDRALDFANKEKITEQLYPLFVHDIGALLYHPSNQTRAGVGANAMAAVDRRRADQRFIGPPQTSQPPALHHHHSMSTPMSTHISQSPHSIAPHPASGRPGLDRAHTFPTPPTSASSIVGMGNQGSSYEWGGSAVSTMQGSQPLSIDTGLSNARSVPTTPATTPPGNSMGNMPQYSTSQAYDASRQLYTATTGQQGQYTPQQNMGRYNQTLQPSPFAKNDMAPPARAGGDSDQVDNKTHVGIYGADQVGHGAGDEEAEHEHDTEYTHTGAPHNASRGSYSYNPNAAPGSLHDDHPHLSPEMTGSPSHQNGSGRATPRTTNPSQAAWSASYSTPQRAQTGPASNLYNVMSDPRGTNGNSGAEAYPSSAPMQPGYAPQAYAGANGVTPSNKRGRDDEEEQDPYGRPASHGDVADADGLKRRKTIREDSVGGAVSGNTYDHFDRDSGRPLARTKSAVTQRRR